MTAAITGAAGAAIQSGLGGCALPWENSGASPPGGALVLDGVNDYFAIATNAVLHPTPDLTVQGFITPTAFAADGTSLGLLNHGNWGVSSAYGVRVGGASYGDQLIASVAQSLSEVFGNAFIIRAGRYSAPPPGIKSHFAFVISGTSVLVYINGNALVFATTGSYAGGVLAPTAAFELGAIVTSGVRAAFFGAAYSRWKIHASALSASQIVQCALGNPPAGGVDIPFINDINDHGSAGLTGTLGGGAAIVRTSSASTIPFRAKHTLAAVGHSNVRGKECDFQSGDAEVSRGGSRRTSSEDLMSYGLLPVWVGNNGTVGGWCNAHDGVDGAKVDEMLSRIDALSGTAIDTFVFWGGLNDVRAPYSADTIMTNQRSALTHIAGMSPLPGHVIWQRESQLPAGGPQTLELLEGLRAFQRGVLVEEMVAAGYQSWISLADPTWTSADNGTDNVHINGTGHLRNGRLWSTIARTRPGLPSMSIPQTERASLRTLFGSELYALWDTEGSCTITSTELASLPDRRSAENGTGGIAAVQATAARRPKHTGANAEFLDNNDSDGDRDWLETGTSSHAPSAGPRTFACRFRNYRSSMTAGTGQAIIGSFAPGSTYDVVQIRNNAGSYYIYFTFASGAGSFTNVCIPFTFDTNRHTLIVEWGGNDHASTSDFTVRLDGSVVATQAGLTAGGFTLDIGTIGCLRIGSSTLLPWYGTIGRPTWTGALDTAKRAALLSYVAGDP